MRLSRFFLPILKETPKEAEIISHRLMLRAGMVRQQSQGIYSWLPLGKRVLDKVCAIVREEQNRAGAQEIAHRYHLALGIGLIVIGVYILYNSFFLSLFANFLNALPYDLNWLWRIASNLPTLVVAILLVMFGLRLMRGGRKKEKPDELVEFKGDD